MKLEVNQIIGKTIVGYVIKESHTTLPRSLVILVFSDNTTYEFHGMGSIRTTAGLWPGGFEYARGYLNHTHETVLEGGA